MWRKTERSTTLVSTHCFYARYSFDWMERKNPNRIGLLYFDATDKGQSSVDVHFTFDWIFNLFFIKSIFVVFIFLIFRILPLGKKNNKNTVLYSARNILRKLYNLYFIIISSNANRLFFLLSVFFVVLWWLQQSYKSLHKFLPLER